MNTVKEFKVIRTYRWKQMIMVTTLSTHPSIGEGLPVNMLIQEFYGQLQADADAATQPPVQTGSPEMFMVSDPPCSAEQNACPNAV